MLQPDTCSYVELGQRSDDLVGSIPTRALQEAAPEHKPTKTEAENETKEDTED